MKLDVIKIGNEVLRSMAKPVDNINKDIKKLVKDMEDTMKKENGVGIAAPQINVSKRIILVRPERKTFIFINPIFISKSKETEIDSEGCLSVPGECIKISRSKSVVVEFMDIDGEYYRLEANDIFARIIQHEIDHLDGKLIVDYKK